MLGRVSFAQSIIVTRRSPPNTPNALPHLARHRQTNSLLCTRCGVDTDFDWKIEELGAIQKGSREPQPVIMAEVAVPEHHAGLSPVADGPLAVSGGPIIEMVRNADFSFPRQPAPSLAHRREVVDDTSRRPASMHLHLPPPQYTVNSHRRTVSTLPSFAFNSADTSGLNEADSDTPPQTPDDNAPVTPSRRGHRRGGSEFVGGDSRFGVSNAVSSSPTKANTFPVPALSAAPPTPSARRGHAHRRSAAISSHDVGSIMQPSETQRRLSSSLPTTPLEYPTQDPKLDRVHSSPEGVSLSDPFGPPLEDADGRPPSRPRVEFADNVEFIPRPLSTISSETESSLSTLRGHSLNNSISSMLSMGTPSPPSSRVPRSSVSVPDEETSKPKARSSLEISKRIEKEGEWLKSRSSGSLKRTAPQSTAAAENGAVKPEQAEPRIVHSQKHSLGCALGFDRRKSEPSMGMSTTESSRRTKISLQESRSAASIVPETHELAQAEHFPSAKKIKQWAASKMSRKMRETNRPITASSSKSSIRPVSADSAPVPGRVPYSEPPVAETDLDAVFSSQGIASEPIQPNPQLEPCLEIEQPSATQYAGLQTPDDDPDMMVDLDAAEVRSRMPQSSQHRQRRELHSSRLTKDFSGPGGHYHRRAESAPTLIPFDSGRLGTTQLSMADVFEEEEEEEPPASVPKPASIPPNIKFGEDDEAGVGVEIVDSDGSLPEMSSDEYSEDGLGLRRAEWDPERPTTAYSTVSSRHSNSGFEPRAASIAEETIVEEAYPGEIEIVEAHEEPRSSSLTKSSDSSDTPTILPPPIGTLTLPDGSQSVMTPETYQTSTFSSPDLCRRQTSFDTSRLGTSASSVTDYRTMSSYATGEVVHDLRTSVDDLPSLTSSRSTMMSNLHANSSHRDFSGSNSSRVPSASSSAVNTAMINERRRKRSSIQSLSQLMGGSFNSKSKGLEGLRPHTAAETGTSKTPKKKEHRLKKLMFWKSKHHGSKHALLSEP